MHRLFYLLSFLSLTSFAQTDSVIVTGQIRHLSVRLYQQSPNVVVTRTNIVRGGSEQAFLAPLQPDGRFRVAVPIIYPLEEMAIQFGGGDRTATTSFLAAAGQLSVDVDNDSLFTASIPFRFGGINAQVNQQHAQYEAAAYLRQATTKSERERAIRRASNASSINQAYQLLLTAFTAPFDQFALQREVFPLVRDWVRSSAQYDAAAFVFDRATSSMQTIPIDQLKTMGLTNTNLLTPSRANAMDRLGAHAVTLIGQTISNQGSIKIQLLASLLSKYGRNLTAADQERLAAMRATGSARSAELRYLAKLMERNPDTLNRLLIYEQTIQTARARFDSSSIDYLKAYLLTSSIQQATQQVIQFTSDYIRPQIGDPLIRQSFNEVVRQALRDTAQVRQARTQYRALAKQTGVNYGPIADAIYVATGAYRLGDELLKNAIDRNRGKVIYIVKWSPDQPNGLQLARDAQRLSDVFSSRELVLLYLATDETDDELWIESLIRNRLRGDHIRLSNKQTYELSGQLAFYDQNVVRLITPEGKVYRRQALLPSPDDFPKLIDQIQGLLK